MASFWAVPSWQVLHVFALTNSDARAYNELLHAFSIAIPCPTCREHMQEFLQTYPLLQYIKSNSSRTLFSYSVALHNNVNKLQNKPIVSLDEAKNIWTNFIRNFAQRDNELAVDAHLDRKWIIAVCALSAVVLALVLVIVLNKKRTKLTEASALIGGSLGRSIASQRAFTFG